MSRYILYCITTISPMVDLSSLDEALEVIEHRGLCAVVSPTDLDYLRPNRRALLQFQRTLEQIMAQGMTILPMRFGTIANSAGELQTLILDAQYDELIAWLDRMTGKHEVGLRVMWERDDLFRTARETLPADTIQQVGGDMHSQIALGQKVEIIIKAIHAHTAEKIMQMLDGLYVDVVEETIPDEITSLACAFLVENAAQEAFDSAIIALDAHFEGKLTFKVVSPLPVYSFVNLSIALNEV